MQLNLNSCPFLCMYREFDHIVMKETKEATFKKFKRPRIDVAE